MNRRLRIILIMSVFVLLLSSGLVYQGAAQEPQETETGATRTVSVTGIGQASAEPDVAVVTLGVRTDAATAQEALTHNNQNMEQLLDALRDAGIAEEDIQTLSIQLFPRFEETQGQQETTPEIAGYTASNIVEVRIRDTDQLGEIIDSAVSAGGNTIEGIRFEVESGRDDLYSQALEAAMADAQVKAEQLASLAGGQLGDVLQVSEISSVPILRDAGGAAREAAVPIQPGTQAITVNLQVTWALVTDGGVIPGTGRTPTAAVNRTATPAASATRTAAATRAATSTEEATETEAATATERGTATAEATATREPTDTAEATETEAATATGRATATEEATETTEPGATDEATETEPPVATETEATASTPTP